MKNWDAETADTCRLPELIPDICEWCRDYDYCHRQLNLSDMRRDYYYCHRQLTLSDMLKGTQEETNAQNN